MPRLTVPEVHLPELHLPEMSREDITRALNDVRRRDVDLDVDLPKVDLSKVEMPKVDLSKIDLSKIDLPKALATAAQAAGIAKATRRPSRWPIVLGALVTIGVVGFAIATSPVFRPRLEAMARRARQVIDERRGIRTEPVAFDAAPTAPVQPSTWSDDAPVTGSPYDGPSRLPEGLGAEPTTVPEATTA